MADPNQTLRFLREATIHLRATNGRRGTVVHLEDAEEVLVAGDLHGNIANFREIVRIADLGTNARRHLVLQEFVHGPGRYAAGGCTSHQLLDLVAALKCQFPHQLHLLLGNHELAEWTGRQVAKAGVAMNALFQQGVANAYPSHAAEVVKAYHALFASMLLGIRTPNRVFISHSIPPLRFIDRFDIEIFNWLGLPEDPYDSESSVYQLVWGRDVSEEAARRFSEAIDVGYLVTGHIAQEAGYAVPNSRQIIVDCVQRPAAILRIPCQRPLTLDYLKECLILLP